jgi:hypothetical protein
MTMNYLVNFGQKTVKVLDAKDNVDAVVRAQEFARRHPHLRLDVITAYRAAENEPSDHIC